MFGRMMFIEIISMSSERLEVIISRKEKKDDGDVDDDDNKEKKRNFRLMFYSMNNPNMIGRKRYLSM